MMNGRKGWQFMFKRHIIKVLASLAIILSLLGGIALGAHETAKTTPHLACGGPYLPPCF